MSLTKEKFALGLNATFVLNDLGVRLNYAKRWPKEESTIHTDGRLWMRQTVEDLARGSVLQFETIKRTLTVLRRCGIVQARQDLNDSVMDKTLWYTIDESTKDAYLAHWRANGSPRFDSPAGRALFDNLCSQRESTR